MGKHSLGPVLATLLLGAGAAAGLAAADDGYSGSDGNDGTNGVDGNNGGPGADGLSGLDGTAGAAGLQGLSGVNGMNGVAGAGGQFGASGPSGAAGAAGDNGADGFNGLAGFAGENGANGAPGNAGANGAAGLNAFAGAPGQTGAGGQTGLSGLGGAPGGLGLGGADGANGLNGLSGAGGHTGSDGSAGAGGISGISGGNGRDGRDGRDGAPTRIAVATAYAPALMASSDTCMGSTSVAGQVAGVGLSVASTWRDDNCRRLKNVRQLDALGYRRAAVALLCVDDEVRAAMRVAGTPCPGEDLVSFQPPPAPEVEPAPPPDWPRYSVLYDFDSARLRPEADETLQQMLATLQAEPDANVDIVGHTDWVGTDAYNLGLSQRRAQSVVDWLIAHGIARERLNAVGMGESEPIASNEAPLGRQQNRRVEIRRRG